MIINCGGGLVGYLDIAVTLQKSDGVILRFRSELSATESNEMGN